MSNAILLRDHEAAKLLNMQIRKLVRLAKQGKVPSVLLPDGEFRFVESDLRAWIESCKTIAEVLQ